MKLKEILRTKKQVHLTVKEEKISEEEIKRLLRDEILQNDTEIASSDDICFDLIKMTKCDTVHAVKVFDKMRELGLDLCRDKRTLSNYNLIKFAILREYITIQEFATFTQKKEQIEKEISRQRIMEKYGSNKSKWPKEVRDKYNRGVKE